MVTQATQKFSVPLFLSPVISRMGDSLYLFGLNWFVVRATGDTSLLGIIQAFGGVVLFFGDLFCGVLIDHYNRKRILLAAEFISLVACFSLAMIIKPERPDPWQLLLLTGILDVGVAFSFPAAKAIVPEVIRPDSLQSYNAITNTSLNLADVIAPLIGGFLLTIDWINFKEFLMINGLSFTLSFGLLLGMRYHFSGQMPAKEGVWQSLSSGFTYLGQQPALVENTLLAAVGNLFYAAVRLVLPADVTRFYQGNAAYYSYLLTGIAIGGIVGGLRLTLSRRPATRRANYRDLGLAVVALLIAGFWRTYLVLLVAVSIYGFCMACFDIRAFTMTQNLTDNAYLGRIFGVWFIAMDAIQPAGSFIFGFVTNWAHNATLAIIGGGLGAALLVIWRLRRWLDQRLAIKHEG